MSCGALAHNADRIFKIQKKGIRNMVGASICKPIFRDLKIMPLPCVYIFKMLSYVHANSSLFLLNNFNHNYNTRGAENLLIPNHQLATYERSPKYMGIILYNKVPIAIKNTNLSHFKNIIKEQLLKECYYSVQEFLNSNFV